MSLISRRLLLSGSAAALAASNRRVFAQQPTRPPRTELSSPIGWPGRVLGDGFFIRHGYACENTWYNPGYWHTGEDWYALEGETAGAEIVAVGDGTVVYVGSDYPGRVVIVQHEDELFSMYGHLDYDVPVSEGDEVLRRDRLGTVLLRTDGSAPSHLHFEMRTFLMTPEVNGASPRYGFACGYECPPGPGYWPMDAPEHPDAMGWMRPLELVMMTRTWEGDEPAVIVAEGAASPVEIWTNSPGMESGAPSGEYELVPGAEFTVKGGGMGDPSGTGTSAEAYGLWFMIEDADGVWGWVQAVVPDDGNTGSDGRPSSVRFHLLPQTDGNLP